MATFQETMKLATQRTENKESAARLREILGMLKKHGVREGLNPEKAVAVLQDLGPTFVKIGQIASNHPDILPKEYCDAFAKLRANVTPMTVDVVRKKVEDELGKPIDELFSSFDDKALGSASIAQVHKAVLREEGIVVAVKVQRPGVVETVTRDLALMRRLLTLYEFVEPENGGISFKELVDELERTSRDELDFDIEASNLDRFYEHNHNRACIFSPRCYHEYSTHAVLTMDYAPYPSIDNQEALAKFTDSERDSLGTLIAHNFMQQVIEDGFFHADPHSGNILIANVPSSAKAETTETADDKSDPVGTASALLPSIEWIDFGMMGEISTKDRETIMNIAKAIGKQDAYGLKRAMLQLARPTDSIDHSAILAYCDNLIENYANSDLASFDTGRLINELIQSMTSSGFEFDPAITMLARGLVTLEGTIRMVSDRVSIMSVITSYAHPKLNLDEIEGRLRKNVAMSVESTHALVELPLKAAETLDMMQKGQIKVQAGLGMDKTFRAELSSSMDHFTLGIIAIGLFIGSCILCLTELEPRMLGVPLLGMIGFAMGLGIAIYDFYEMHKERKYRK